MIWFSYHVLALGLLFAASASAQGTLPITTGTVIEQTQTYLSASGNHYLIFQADGNLVVYTSNGGYIWGLNLTSAPFWAASRAEFQADGNLVVSDANGGRVWSALRWTTDPQARLDINPSGALRILSASQQVLWSSHGDSPQEADLTVQLREDIQACRDGLGLLAANLYRYPENPTVALTDRRAWIDVFGAFKHDDRTACEGIGSFLTTLGGDPIAAGAEATLAANGMDTWNAYFTGTDGLVTLGDRIGAECPSSQGNAFDCTAASSRIGDTILPQTQSLMVLLNALECMPDQGWSHCRQLDRPNIRIMGTADASYSAMSLVKTIYSEMTSRMTADYDLSQLDSYIAYLTNGEGWADLVGLSPIGPMMIDGDGINRGDELRGGSGQNHLWISEQMICKRGVATRNQAYSEGRRDSPDDEYRSFDQVIHEFGHSIDQRYGLRNRILNVYAGGWNPVEQFPWNIQYWFSSPQGTLSASETAFIGEIFASTTAFSCDAYDPEAMPVASERTNSSQFDETALLPNLPNPFSASTRIPFELARPSDVTLRVYDALGREVAVLADRDYPTGRSEVVWDATPFPSGMYVYLLETDTSTELKTMILAR